MIRKGDERVGREQKRVKPTARRGLDSVLLSVGVKPSGSVPDMAVKSLGSVVEESKLGYRGPLQVYAPEPVTERKAEVPALSNQVGMYSLDTTLWPWLVECIKHQFFIKVSDSIKGKSEDNMQLIMNDLFEKAESYYNLKQRNHKRLGVWMLDLSVNVAIAPRDLSERFSSLYLSTLRYRVKTWQAWFVSSYLQAKRDDLGFDVFWRKVIAMFNEVLWADRD